jgi:hypothetical protein
MLVSCSEGRKYSLLRVFLERSSEKIWNIVETFVNTAMKLVFVKRMGFLDRWSSCQLLKEDHKICTVEFV